MPMKATYSYTKINYILNSFPDFFFIMWPKSVCLYILMAQVYVG